MKIFRIVLALVLFGFPFVMTAPVEAHHSVAAEFDVNKLIPMTGVLTRVELVKPHPWMYVDVKGADGTVKNWQMEFTLRWRPNMAVGQTYKMIVALAKNGKPRAFIVELTFPNGQKFSRAS